VRWLYPVIVTLWSAVGFATGFVQSDRELLVCRALLGLFEGGHWPCAIKTTQRLLEPPDRPMGNSVLQSGASVGAILAPLLMSAMLTSRLESWRIPFQVIGAAGLGWAVFWFALVRAGDLTASSPPPGTVVAAGSAGGNPWRLLFSRRMLVLFLVVACINTCWQTLRAWLPKFLQQDRGYAEATALYFNSLFYVATDIGCLGAGALTLWLARRGCSVHGSRVAVFFGCALLCLLTILTAVLPNGWPLLAGLLLVGAGALGVFPIYHAFTQELSAWHQGKVTGFTGVAAWILSSPAQTLFGRLIDRTGSFDLGLAINGCLPLVAFMTLWLFWDLPRDRKQVAVAGEITRS
jgi:ACS family hexuronate transporter-like MFS transporter